MNGLTGTIQVLIYAPPESVEMLQEFYEKLLGEPPYYSWHESGIDCGVKFRIGSSAIAVLCHGHGTAMGPSAINIECEDIDAFYERLRPLVPGQILNGPHTQPYGTYCFSIRDPLNNIINIYKNGH